MCNLGGRRGNVRGFRQNAPEIDHRAVALCAYGPLATTPRPKWQAFLAAATQGRWFRRSHRRDGTAPICHSHREYRVGDMPPPSILHAIVRGGRTFRNIVVVPSTAMQDLL